MATVTLHEQNGTMMMAIPQEYANRLQLTEGSAIDVSVEGDELIARPAGEYSLDQLLREHAEIMDQLDDNSEWVSAPAVGGELI